MKRHFFSFVAAMLCAACSQNEPEPTQDYTSFVITLKNRDVTLLNVVSGYFDSLGYCRKIAEHGNIVCTKTTEYISKEIILTVDIDSIYLFSTNKFKDPFIVKKNTRNVFNLNEHNPIGVPVDVQDSSQYPH